MKTFRLIIALSSLLAALVWSSSAPLLLEMMRVGEISPLAFLLLVVAVVTLLAGGLRVHFGKSGRLSFALHLVFVGVMSLLMQFALPVPLALSSLVAVVALVWSFTARQAAAGDARDARA